MVKTTLKSDRPWSATFSIIIYRTLGSVRVSVIALRMPYQVIPDHGSRQKRRHCLKAIYLNLSELNISFFIKHSRSVTGKLIEIKKLPENLSINPPAT